MPVLSKKFFDIQSPTEWRFTLKCVCDMIRTQSEITIMMITIIIVRIQLANLNPNDTNLMKEFDCRVVPVAGYLMNVCIIKKHGLERLDKMV